MRGQRTGGWQRIALALICLFLMWFVLAPQDDAGQFAQQLSLQSHGSPGTPLSIQPAKQSGTPIKSGATVAGISCTHTGVTKNPDGTYHFSWLHVDRNGNVIDENTCLVHLLGLNQGWFASGDAGYPSPQEWTQWKQALPYNIVRLNYNPVYWNTDVFVPKSNMHFRAIVQDYIKNAEAHGFYIELDTGPQQPEPPCGGSVTFCSSQNQAAKDYAANPNPQTAQEMPSYTPPGDQSITDLTKLYGNDPAVIFDVWNEPGDGNFNQMLPDAQFFPAMQNRINIVNTNAPKSLVVVYAHDIPQITGGQFPPYHGKNILIDHHTYSASFTASQMVPNIQFYQQHGWGTIVNEYGGSTASAPALQQLSSLAKQYDVGLVYFYAGNLVNNNTVQLNSNGQLVQNAYTSIFGSPLTTSGP